MALFRCYTSHMIWVLLISIVGTVVAKREIIHTTTGVQVLLDDETLKQMGDNRRVKRQEVVTGLTDAQHTLAVNKHNELRAQEGSSNMFMMRKNDELAAMAQEWAETCQYKHGQPARDPAVYEPSEMGQNLYALIGSKTALDVEDATTLWYNEKEYYTYTSGKCEAGQVCGHYTQVVWAQSDEIGCGAYACDVATKPSGETMNNVVYIVCNYWPGGNVKTEKPYLMGSPCTECREGQMTCSGGLCYGRDCEDGNEDCECAAECANCGNVTEDCRCQCTSGWSGINCAAACEDTMSGNQCSGYKHYCTDDEWGIQTRRECPVTCNVCTAADENTPECKQDTDGDMESRGVHQSYSHSFVIAICSLTSQLLVGHVTRKYQ